MVVIVVEVDELVAVVVDNLDVIVEETLVDVEVVLEL